MSTTPCGFLAFLQLVLLVPWQAQASITIMETAKSFPSRPEKKLGHQLWKGSEYMGRMQFVHGNLQLCKSVQDPHRRFAINESMDGLPIAIYAKSGGCTLEEKAYVASNLLDPPNIVGYLIVDDDRSSRSKKRRNDSSYFSFLQNSELLADDNEDLLDDFIDLIPGTNTGETDEDLGSLWEELMTQVQNRPPVPFEARTLPPLEMDVMANDPIVPVQHLVDDDETRSLVASTDTQLLPNTDDASASDDEMIPLPLERFRVKQGENAWWRGGDEIQGDDAEMIENDGHRNLKHHHRDSDSINVAILHVTSRVGYELLDLLLKENSEVGRVGGPKILLNSKEPNAAARTIFVWAVMSIILGGCACCCMLVCLEFIGEEEPRAPPQPVRRRLTSNQVREKFPAFHYHPENHVEQPLDDECAICLDDFSEGMRLRRLPCGHVFHSTCIARWLIERSAFCPLCKVDLYEAEETENHEGSGRARTLQQRYGVLQGMTSWLGQRNDGPTPNANTTSNTFWTSWWTRPPPTSPTRTPPLGGAAVGPAAPPARAFQWTYHVVPPAPVESDGDAVSTSTSISPLAAAASRWFTRRRRMGTGTEESRMLTELTEPLIPSGAAGNPEVQVSSSSGESAPTVTEASSPITPAEDLSTPNNGQGSSSPPSSPGTSTPIEV